MLSSHPIDGNRMSSLQRRIYVASYALSRIAIYLPFVVVAAFILERQLLLVIDPPFFSKTAVSHFQILQDQYEFLSEEYRNPTQEYRDQVDVGLFHLFEFFIWAASGVGLLRIITGACSRAVLDSSLEKLKKAESMGRSPLTVLFFCLVCAPLCGFFSLHFQLVSDSISLGTLMAYSPRWFMCLLTFVFCGSVAFVAEGLLVLFSLVF
jgi:hypothetical protein